GVCPATRVARVCITVNVGSAIHPRALPEVLSRHVGEDAAILRGVCVPRSQVEAIVVTSTGCVCHFLCDVRIALHVPIGVRITTQTLPHSNSCGLADALIVHGPRVQVRTGINSSRIDSKRVRSCAAPPRCRKLGQEAVGSKFWWAGLIGYNPSQWLAREPKSQTQKEPQRGRLVQYTCSFRASSRV